MAPLSLMILNIFHILLTVMWWIIIVQAVTSWLVAFNVINSSNQFVGRLWSTLDQITEPLYRPLRKVLPNLNGLDLAPIGALVSVWILDGPVREYLTQLALSNG